MKRRAFDADKGALEELQTVPGVGREVSRDLYGIGIRRVADLKGKSPERLYEDLCEKQGTRVDRCMLYTFRCAVYYAETAPAKRDPEKLKWWNWKD